MHAGPQPLEFLAAPNEERERALRLFAALQRPLEVGGAGEVVEVPDGGERGKEHGATIC